MKDLDLKELEGKTVRNALVNADKNIVILETDHSRFFLTWVGDCCAMCYLAGINGADNLKDAQILSVENSEWKNLKNDEENMEVIESMGTKFKTSKGYVDFESRVEHNGYYGGDIQVSNEAPLNQYRDAIETAAMKFDPLTDF